MVVYLFIMDEELSNSTSFVLILVSCNAYLCFTNYFFL